MHPNLERHVIRPKRVPSRMTNHPGVSDTAQWFIVRKDSPISLRIAAEDCGRMAMREIGLDSLPYTRKEDDPSSEVWCYLPFNETPGGDSPALGFAVFDQMSLTCGSWRLSLVWVHPFQRHTGVVSRMWPEWQKLYPEFTVMEPVSPAMRLVLKKFDNPQYLEIP